MLFLQCTLDNATICHYWSDSFFNLDNDSLGHSWCNGIFNNCFLDVTSVAVGKTPRYVDYKSVLRESSCTWEKLILVCFAREKPTKASCLNAATYELCLLVSILIFFLTSTSIWYFDIKFNCFCLSQEADKNKHNTNQCRLLWKWLNVTSSRNWATNQINWSDTTIALFINRRKFSIISEERENQLFACTDLNVFPRQLLSRT